MKVFFCSAVTTLSMQLVLVDSDFAHPILCISLSDRDNLSDTPSIRPFIASDLF